MKKALLLSILFCCQCLLILGQSTKRVLFLGNSYTYFNNMPQLVASVAGSAGDTFIFDSNTPDGYTLQQHSSNTTSINKIKGGYWDYVVMQEQSQLPAFEEYNYAAAYNLSGLIRTYNPCGRILYYMTWGRKNGDAGNCAVWPPICTYEGMDSLLRLRYTETAMLTDAGLAPVGAVWRYVRQNHPSIELYQTDESHPTLAGSYLAACCFYTSIFKKDPTLILYDGGLNASDADNIRKAVKAIVFSSLAQWDFGKYIPDAQFSYVIGSGTNEVIFTNNSTNADSYEWDFGDGNSSTSKNAVHQYAADGTYTIKLKAINCDLTSTHVSTKQVTISFCAHTPTVYPDDLLLCPNIKDTLWTQEYDTYQWLDGSGNTIPGETKQYILPQGGNSYSVLVRKNNCTEQSQQVYVSAYIPFGTYYVTATANFVAEDTLCAGDTITLILAPNKPPYPEDKNIEWYRNGVVLPASATDTLQVTISGEYAVKLYDTVCKDFVKYQSPQTLYTFINCTGPNTGIIPTETEHGIRLYPNPAKEMLQVYIPSSLLGFGYTISDVFGKTILTGICTQETNAIPLNGFSSGIYILHIQNQIVKFIKD